MRNQKKRALLGGAFMLVVAAMVMPQIAIAQAIDDGCLQHPVTLVCGDSWINTCPRACD